ncbi:replication initiator protein A [Streptococcus parasanguinis]|uniref:replication initiator protein A n=1 Tax=Streptococcus parasanguinis TaxID=1318 RepID=UPI0020C86741|nr:replication initiator protein A [Streptococcus parasanguinis]
MKINEVKNNTFYQLPQWLFDPEYKNMSLRAKVVYALIFDRRSLSLENNWYDKNGDVYMYFTNQQMMEKLNCSEKTIISSKKELEKYGLIKEVRQGVNRPNRLYINGTVKITGQELENLQYGTVKITGQELENLQPIKTNNIKTNNNHTNIIICKEDDENLIFKKLKEAFGEMSVNGTMVEEVEKLLKQYGQELVVLALDKTILNAGKSLRYTMSILQRWDGQRLRTAEQIRVADEEYERKKSNKTQVDPYGNIPSWSNLRPENQKEPEPEMSDEEYERRLKEFLASE